MMVHVQSSFDPPPIAIELIEGAATAALEHQAADGELTVVLTDDAQLQRLNRDYLGIDAPTDVLAFPAAETDPDSGVKYLGDVLISIPKAEDQARAVGHPLESEVQLLVVHGALHLLGHDHAQTAAKSRMWAAQDAVLRRLGLDGVVIQDT